MIVHIPLLLLLLTNAAPSDAALFSRSSESLTRAAKHVGRHISKRSSGLLEDMRLAYAGLRQQQQPQVLLASKLFCTNNVGTGLTGIGSGGSNSSNGSSESGSDGSDGSSGSTTSSEPVAASSSDSVSPTATQTGSGSSPSHTSTGPAGPSSSSSTSSPSSQWKVVQQWQGDTFFDAWTFINTPDTWTHGIVQYVDRPTANSASLIDINDAGNAIMRVETTPTVSGNRQSIRLESLFTYTGGLIIIDAVHMPTGCGTWPAFWSNGPNWPVGGEIDMVEGVHEYTNNQVTLHTNPGCTMSSSDPNILGITGSLVANTDCAVATTANAGCGVRASQTNSFGAPFNSNGGGVYATLWDDDGIKNWFFPRGSVPDDIDNGAPQPSGWSKPIASFPASTCKPSTYFYSHTAIFDTTLCGDWAGGVWGAAGVPGQEQSCAARTGVATCEDYVRGNGAAFSEAYWEVKYVKIYQTNS
ncbi:glycoside hydrolase family 16 protein [Polyporus arcularius HHB13444]|uniref:Glycoside hydrolase family 16 protein n=1 Tax=Polyporus arcularius HHB13444 TaxID=1314778 RepID=A0A5C3P9I1_9APHY|nr:glycoside hydrolase family 16 protein [Polyporus arcularius HHB13444]